MVLAIVYWGSRRPFLIEAVGFVGFPMLLLAVIEIQNLADCRNRSAYHSESQYFVSPHPLHFLREALGLWQKEH